MFTMTLDSHRACAAQMLLLATITVVAALTGPGPQPMAASAPSVSAVRVERGLAARVVAHRLQGGPTAGLRVAALGSGYPVKLSRPLILTYDESDRMAGWIASLQRTAYQRMGEMIEALSLVEVTKAEAAWRAVAFAIDKRWFAVDAVDLLHRGRADLAGHDRLRNLFAETACRFMSQVAATPALPGSCAVSPFDGLAIARQ